MWINGEFIYNGMGLFTSHECSKLIGKKDLFMFDKCRASGIPLPDPDLMRVGTQQGK